MRPFKNNLKDLDPSCKMDLDLWDCFGRKKIVLLLHYRLIYIFKVILEEKTVLWPNKMDLDLWDCFGRKKNLIIALQADLHI